MELTSVLGTCSAISDDETYLKPKDFPIYWVMGTGLRVYI